MSTAAKVAAHKEKHPELYCPTKKCLWRTGNGTHCPRHTPKVQEAPIRQPPSDDAANETCASDLDGAQSPIE